MGAGRFVLLVFDWGMRVGGEEGGGWLYLYMKSGLQRWLVSRA